MTNEQHNDNLERFFKKNLENYSAMPSDDFWGRLDPVIPTKPPFWSGWKAYVGKMAGLIVVVGAVAWVGMTWYNDRKEVKELREIVAVQQRQLSNENESLNKNKEGEIKGSGFIDGNENAGVQKRDLESKNLNTKQNSSYKNKTENQAVEEKSNLFVQANQNSFNLNNKIPQALITDKITSQNKSDKNTLSKNILEKTVANVFAETTKHQENINQLNLLDLNTLSAKQNTPSVKAKTNKAFKPFTRISFEGGASVFIQPMSRLFSDSTSFDSGKMGVSSGGGLLFNFELNSSWMLQSGFYYNNVKTDQLSLKYNNFPLVVRKKYAWGHRQNIELKTGIGMNILISEKNNSPEPIAVPDLKKGYVDLLLGAAYTNKLMDRASLIVEPKFGYSLTPIVADRRTYNLGLHVGFRYSLL